MTQSNYNPTSGAAGNAPPVEVMTAVVTPFDRVRWGPILAGLFSALATLALLSVAGLAVGFTAWDPGDNTRHYSIAAGIWSIVSALIAFFVGGYIAARSAAVAGERNGVLNGSMVWAVAIPLLIFMLGGGMASLADTVVNGNNSRVVYMDRGGDRNAGDNTDRAQTAAARIGQSVTGQDLANATGNNASNDNNAGIRSGNPPTRDEARTAAKSAWWTLVSLVLGLCASAGGGLAGARSIDSVREGDRRPMPSNLT